MEISSITGWYFLCSTSKNLCQRTHCITFRQEDSGWLSCGGTAVNEAGQADATNEKTQFVHEQRQQIWISLLLRMAWNHNGLLAIREHQYSATNLSDLNERKECIHNVMIQGCWNASFFHTMESQKKDFWWVKWWTDPPLVYPYFHLLNSAENTPPISLDPELICYGVPLSAIHLVISSIQLSAIHAWTCFFMRQKHTQCFSKYVTTVVLPLISVTTYPPDVPGRK